MSRRPLRSTDTRGGGGSHRGWGACRGVAAYLGGEAKDYRALGYARPPAGVVGTGLFGVSAAVLAEADQQVKIPMMGVTQSLNVSVACAIVLYEAMRQRQAAGMYGQNRLDDALLRQQRFEWLHPKVAEFCRQRGLQYPVMDEEGHVIGDFPRGTPALFDKGRGSES